MLLTLKHEFYIETFGEPTSSQSLFPMPVELLDSTSEIGILHAQYLLRLQKQEKEARKYSKEIFAAITVCSVNESARVLKCTNGSQNTTYSNGGKTSEDINAIRSANQETSALLRLPTEILITIWKTAFGSPKTTRVHGMVATRISENRILSLAHTCSLLHNIIYPVFLSQDAFVVKIPSPDFTVAASELTRWSNRIPSASILSGTVKPLILLELQTGRLSVSDARKLATEMQLVYSPPKPFQPTIAVETTEANSAWYCGMNMNVLAWPPATEDKYNQYGMTRPSDQHDVWKGWVVTKGVWKGGREFNSPKQFQAYREKSGQTIWS